MFVSPCGYIYDHQLGMYLQTLQVIGTRNKAFKNTIDVGILLQFTNNKSNKKFRLNFINLTQQLKHL
jgi:hypothetical protein